MLMSHSRVEYQKFPRPTCQGRPTHQLLHWTSSRWWVSFQPPCDLPSSSSLIFTNLLFPQPVSFFSKELTPQFYSHQIHQPFKIKNLSILVSFLFSCVRALTLMRSLAHFCSWLLLACPDTNSTSHYVGTWTLPEYSQALLQSQSHHGSEVVVRTATLHHSFL
jgi:hypothetical protein